ncbi:MAG: HlyD family efflux transporter periplasmic adaptor subunit [Christensenellales bacterium]
MARPRRAYRAAYERETSINIGRRRIKPRFILLAALILVGLGLGAYFLTRPKEHAVDYGVVTDRTSMDCVIVRDEVIVTSLSSGKINYLAAEGERITGGTAVVSTYGQGYSQKTLDELAKVREEIYAYQRKGVIKDIIDEDLAALDEEIEEITGRIAAMRLTGDYGDIETLEAELETAMRDRTDYLKRITPGDATLQELYDRETELLETAAAFTKQVEAPSAGVISYCFDGREQVFSTANLDHITASMVKDAKKLSESQRTVQAVIDRPVFRIVNAHHWYVLIVTPVGDQSFVQGQSYELAFAGIESATFTGQVVAQKSGGSGTLQVLQMQQEIGPLLSVRAVGVAVEKQFEGLIVPSSAIKTRRGQDVVQVKTVDGGKKSIPVKVMVDDGEKAAVEPLEPGALNQGQTVFSR